MAKHVHEELILQWLKDLEEGVEATWIAQNMLGGPACKLERQPGWDPEYKYFRIAPQKPDVVRDAILPRSQSYLQENLASANLWS